MSSAFDSEDFCFIYLAEKSGNLAFYTLISIGISIVNVFIIQVNTLLIRKIGFTYKSQTISVTMISVFLTQFFNTGILLLFTNANFEHSFLSFIPINGEHSDFSTRWYLDMGPLLIRTMQVISIFPYLNFIIFYFLK